ncbi:hypothetical protein, partial [Rhodobium orientis]|uniref:hypothetical protein n=1 Tax=Rhodobium orientis TaxID=34017 RepID=UPI001AECBBBD
MNDPMERLDGLPRRPSPARVTPHPSDPRNDFEIKEKTVIASEAKQSRRQFANRMRSGGASGQQWAVAACRTTGWSAMRTTRPLPSGLLLPVTATDW